MFSRSQASVMEIDGDLVCLARNLSVIEKLKDKIEKAGYKLKSRKRPTVKNGRLTGEAF